MVFLWLDVAITNQQFCISIGSAAANPIARTAERRVSSPQAEWSLKGGPSLGVAIGDSSTTDKWPELYS